MPTDVFFSKTELCGDEQRNGTVQRDVLDCGGTVALENDSGALWIQSEHDPLLRLSGCERAGLGKVKALAVKTLWLQEVDRERGPPSKGNKADLGTKVLPLNTLRGACGVVVPGELSKHTVESQTEWDID